MVPTSEKRIQWTNCVIKEFHMIQSDMEDERVQYCLYRKFELRVSFLRDSSDLPDVNVNSSNE